VARGSRGAIHTDFRGIMGQTGEKKNNMGVKKAQRVMEGPSDIWLQRDAN